MSEQIIPVVMPKWGLSMKEGLLAAWLVDEGTTIQRGQDIMEVETDKITNVVEAADGGLFRRRVAEAGKVYPIKALLGVLAPSEVSDVAIEDFVLGYDVPTDSEDEEEEAPTYQYVETGVGRLRYAMRPGTGDAVVFLHGFGGDLDNWLFNIDAMAEVGQAYALDLPAHGQSTSSGGALGLDEMTGGVKEFLESLDLRGVHVVGHSMGGAVAANLALRNTGLVKSLTLIAPAGFGEEINSAYIDGFVRSQSRRELRPVLELLFADPSQVSRSLVDDVLKFKRLDGVEDALGEIASVLFGGGRQTRMLAGDLSPLDVPVQIIWGAKDAIIPPAHAAALSGAKVDVIDNAGHMVQMEAAARVNLLIRTHIAEADAGRT